MGPLLVRWHESSVLKGEDCMEYPGLKPQCLPVEGSVGWSPQRSVSVVVRVRGPSGLKTAKQKR